MTEPEPRFTDSVLQAYWLEYKRVTGEIQNWSGHIGQILGIGIPALIGFAVLTGQQRSDSYLFEVAVTAVPFMATVLFLWAVAHTYQVVALGRYTNHLESRINDRLGDKVLLWEAISSRGIHRSVPSVATFLVAGCLILSGWVYAIWHSMGKSPAVAGIVAAVGTILSVAASASLYSLVRAPSRFSLIVSELSPPAAAPSFQMTHSKVFERTLR